MLPGFFYLTYMKIIEIFFIINVINKISLENVIMRIAIIGYSGSGKSTLCRFLGEKYGIPMLHFDTVHFLPNWKVRAGNEKEKIVRDFLDENENWCIDGNYSKIFFDERMEKADFIVVMLFTRFNSSWRVWKRYKKYKGQSRPNNTRSRANAL